MNSNLSLGETTRPFFQGTTPERNDSSPSSNGKAHNPLRGLRVEVCESCSDTYSYDSEAPLSGQCDGFQRQRTHQQGPPPPVCDEPVSNSSGGSDFTKHWNQFSDDLDELGRAWWQRNDMKSVLWGEGLGEEEMAPELERRRYIPPPQSHAKYPRTGLPQFRRLCPINSRNEYQCFPCPGNPKIPGAIIRVRWDPERAIPLGRPDPISPRKWKSLCRVPVFRSGTRAGVHYAMRNQRDPAFCPERKVFTRVTPVRGKNRRRLPDEKQFICLKWARNNCEKGKNCLLQHRIPHPETDKWEVPPNRDIFGRIKLDPDEAKSISSNRHRPLVAPIRTTRLRVTGFNKDMVTFLQLRSIFAEYGDINSFVCEKDGGTVIVDYKSRFAAEFVSEALHHVYLTKQDLGLDPLSLEIVQEAGMLNITWASYLRPVYLQVFYIDTKQILLELLQSLSCGKRPLYGIFPRNVLRRHPLLRFASERDFFPYIIPSVLHPPPATPWPRIHTLQEKNKPDELSITGSPKRVCGPLEDLQDEKVAFDIRPSTEKIILARRMIKWPNAMYLLPRPLKSRIEPSPPETRYSPDPLVLLRDHSDYKYLDWVSSDSNSGITSNYRMGFELISGPTMEIDRRKSKKNDHNESGPKKKPSLSLSKRHTKTSLHVIRQEYKKPLWTSKPDPPEPPQQTEGKKIPPGAQRIFDPPPLKDFDPNDPDLCDTNDRRGENSDIPKSSKPLPPGLPSFQSPEMWGRFIEGCRRAIGSLS